MGPNVTGLLPFYGKGRNTSYLSLINLPTKESPCGSTGENLKEHSAGTNRPVSRPVTQSVVSVLVQGCNLTYDLSPDILFSTQKPPSFQNKARYILHRMFCTKSGILRWIGRKEGSCEALNSSLLF